MNLYDGPLQAHRFDLDAHELLFLQLLEQFFEHPGLGPAVHAGVDRVPVAETLWQCPPLTTVLRNIQNRIDDSQVLARNVAVLVRRVLLDASKLLGIDFHAGSISLSVNRLWFVS